MKLVFIGVLLLSTLLVKAQIITPFVLNSATTKGTVTNISFEFSLGEMATTTITNGNILTQGFLQPLSVILNSPLPVIGLDFFPKRINNKHVQLDWSTLQEINNKGFYIERKKEHENNFYDVAFEASKAPSGSSSLSLNYTKFDTNTYNGRTYYRLRQEDKDGKFAYSLVRLVSGDAGKAVTLRAWPIPAKGDLSVSISGLPTAALLVYDVSGRMVKQVQVSEGVVTKITGLSPGSYVLRLQGHNDMAQKVIIQ